MSANPFDFYSLPEEDGAEIQNDPKSSQAKIISRADVLTNPFQNAPPPSKVDGGEKAAMRAARLQRKSQLPPVETVENRREARAKADAERARHRLVGACLLISAFALFALGCVLTDSRRYADNTLSRCLFGASVFSLITSIRMLVSGKSD